MTSNIISYSFVGAWEQPIFLLPVTPLFDNSFSRNLFGDPVNTNTEWRKDNFSISKNINNVITHFVLITPTALQITVSNLNEIPELYSKLIKELDKIFSVEPLQKFNSNFIKRSYTPDIEIIDAIDEKANVWLANKFVKNALNESNYSNISLNTLTFEIIESPTRITTIVIQPRTGKEKGLFFKITAGYHNKTGENFNQLILTEFNEAINHINNDIIKLFIK